MCSLTDYDSEIHFDDSDSSFESDTLENNDIDQSVKHDLILNADKLYKEPNDDTRDQSAQDKNHMSLIEESHDTINQSVPDISSEIEIPDKPNDTVNTLKHQTLATITEEEFSISYNESLISSHEVKDLTLTKGFSLKPGKSWRRSLLFSRKSFLLESDTCIANKGKSFLATYLSKFLSNT